MDDKIVSAERSRLAEAMKRLKASSDWPTFVTYVEGSLVKQHEAQAVLSLAKDKIEDAKRQAWIVEGLLEAIEEPDSIIQQHNQEKGLVARVGAFCALCGQVVRNQISALRAGNNDGKGERNA